MPPPFLDIWSVLTLLGVIQGIFLGVLFLASPRENPLANRLLGTLLLFLAIISLDVWLCYTNYIAYAPFLINLSEALPFTFGPLHYWYTRSVIEKDFRLTRRQLWLLAPAAVYAVLRFPFLLQSNAYKLWDVAMMHNRPFTGEPAVQPVWWFPEYHFGGAILDISLVVWNIPILVLTFRRIYRYARQHHARFFDTRNTTLDWTVRAALYISTVFLVFVITSLTTQNDLGDIYITTAISVVFYCMTIHLITHSRLLMHDRTEPAKKKYEKSSLRTETTEASLQKLVQVMETEKPYQNPNFSLPELANRLSLSTHHLSQLINEHRQQNFFDFVNQYRITEAKKRLLDPAFSHLKIEEIAYDTGFNSKSVFNTAFRKFTGTTPSQFRKQPAVSNEL